MNSRCWLLLIVVPLLPGSAPACTIPVFRYALERWQPSSYQLVVFQKGTLAPAHQQILAQIGAEFSAMANLEVVSIDLVNLADEGLRAVWSRQNVDNEFPWAVLRYPEADPKSLDVWAGPLDGERLRLALDSEVRQKIVAQIGRGASAVFVLLESGDTSADRAAADLLNQELSRLERDVQLPKQDPAISPLRSELPLKVSFPRLRLSRQEAAERTFRQMLLGSEPGLTDVRGPIVFAVYGRGRLLCALHGKDLTAERLGDVARFLCGACSCRVKELNPGIDLLLAADWEKMLEQPAVVERPPPTPDVGRDETPSKPPEQPEPWMAAPSSKGSVSSSVEQQRWLWLAVGGAAVLVVVTGAWLLLTLTRSKTRAL